MSRSVALLPYADELHMPPRPQKHDERRNAVYVGSLSSSYYVRTRGFFVEGRVFAALWLEAAGEHAVAMRNSRDTSLGTVTFEERLEWYPTRRYVVVRQEMEFCYALPLYTYSGRATLKPGIDPSKHSVAYSIGQTPQLLEGENGITKTPIGIDMAVGVDDLVPATRVYYGTALPVQYSVRVKDIGRVHPPHMQILLANWKGEDYSDRTHDFSTVVEGFSKMSFVDVKTQPAATSGSSIPVVSMESGQVSGVDGISDHKEDDENDDSGNMHSVGDDMTSCPYISDRDDQSRGTLPSTVTFSQTRSKVEMLPAMSNIPETGLQDESLSGPGTNHDEATSRNEFMPEFETEDCTTWDYCDTESIYTTDNDGDDSKLAYIQAFANQLAQDTKNIPGRSSVSNIPSIYFDRVLRDFAWMLYGDSSNPFQWHTSVILHQNRKEIIERLTSSSLERVEQSEPSDGSFSDQEEDDGLSKRKPFAKPPSMLNEWVASQIEQPDEDTSVQDVEEKSLEEQALYLLSDYESFIKQSDAYQWLVFKVLQHDRLAFGELDSTSDISTQIRNHLRAQGSLRKMSRRRPPSLIKMTFKLDWNPIRFLRDQGCAASSSNILAKVLCLTGSWEEAQAATVREYIQQTWPITGNAIISLIEELISVPEGQECCYQLPRPKNAQLRASIHPPSSCSISFTGSSFFVSEIAEQIGWLASAMRSTPVNPGVVACYPRIEDVEISTEEGNNPKAMAIGSCRILFEFQERSAVNSPLHGFCWGPLFHSSILVRGYPTLRRLKRNTGLELSIGVMAHLVRSQEIVQWGERIIMKGFNSLLAATLVTSSVVVWHLLVSRVPSERISYIDPRLDAMDMNIPEGFSLRMLEGARHIVGWCVSATDFCGHAMAGLNVKASRLRKPPSSIVIDRLYLEAGADFVGGLNMAINKKEQPFWLEREPDYPSLLGWVASQPIVFYDVSDRRAWLVDGVSALLHLVRLSLYMDKNDPESPYEWVFDASKFKDTWPDCTGRHAALKTLKSWDNLDLNVYVKEKSSRDGQHVIKYSTLGDRVSKILHSVEILIDRQVNIASEDGIKISQSINPRKSLVGFDILDIIKPLGPIGTRISHFDSWGDGWIDLIPSIGVTTIFGAGFGDLIRPDNPNSVCSQWKSLPKDMEYMASSVSTLKMLYERRLQRIEPGLGVGEITNKVLWTSPCQPFKSCGCLRNIVSEGHLDPVQFLVSKKSWKPMMMPSGSAPVDMGKLEEKGAVVFANLSLLGRRTNAKVIEHKGTNKSASSVGNSIDAQETASSSAVGSGETQSTGRTTITAPSSGSSGGGVTQRGGSSKVKGKETLKDKWNSFTKRMSR